MTHLRLGVRRRRKPPPPNVGSLISRYIAGVGETVSGGRVTVWEDQVGSHDLLAVSGGPPTVTDFASRKALRFHEDIDGRMVTTTPTYGSRDIAVYMVGRFRGVKVSFFAFRDYSLAGVNGVLKGQSTGSVNCWGSLNRSFVTQPQRSSISLAGAWNNASTTAFVSEDSTSSQAQSTLDTVCNGWFLGCQASDAVPVDVGDVYEVLVYPIASIPAAADIQAWARTSYDIAADPAGQVLCAGDSITYGFGLTHDETWSWQAWRADTADWRLVNCGVNGDTIADLTGDAAAHDNLKMTGDRNVFMVTIGRNNVTIADNSATVYSDLVTYISGRVAAGWEVWVGTLVTSNASYQPTIRALNERIRGNVGSGIVADAGASHVVDFGSIPGLADTAVATVTYFPDGVHPNAAGAALMGDYFADNFLSVL